MRGEHYSKTIVDLRKFLAAVVYPALERNLDKAFPEFRFVRNRNGVWVAETAPVHYTGYGHRQGKLVGTGWGFRSLITGAPAMLWLSYFNKGVFPRGKLFAQAVAKLAARVRITYKSEPSGEEILEAETEERRDHFLEAFLAYSQGQLAGDLGRPARAYLSRSIGLPPNRLAELDLGFYPSAGEVRAAMSSSGYDTEEDRNLAEVLGLYHPKWEGRIVGPWWDLNGRTIVNLWGRLPGETPFGQEVFVNLNRPGMRESFGSRDIPILLHEAQRLGKQNLVLLESPIKALLTLSLGLKDPFPISTGGPLTPEQTKVLNEYLRRSGSLTLNMDYNPNASDIHADTCRALDALGQATFQIFVVDPVEMAGKGGHPRPVDPASHIRGKGIQSYKALLSKRIPARHYRGHALVREYNPSDNLTEETPTDIIHSVEDFVGEIEERQRAPELDKMFHDALMADFSAEEPSVPEAVVESGAIHPERGTKVEAVEKLFNQAKSLVEILGPDRTTEFLRAELNDLLLPKGGGNGLAPPSEVGARVGGPYREPPPSPPIPVQVLDLRPDSEPKQPEQVAELLVRWEQDYSNLIQGVASGALSVPQTVDVLLRSQQWVQTLLASLQDRLGGRQGESNEVARPPEK